MISYRLDTEAFIAFIKKAKGNMNTSQFAEKIGVCNYDIKNILNRHTKEPKVSVFWDICKKMNVKPKQFIITY